MSWRDHEPGRPGVSVAQLGDGDGVTAQIIAEPFRRDTEHSENALHVPVVFIGDLPDGFEDMSGDSVEKETEYNIINSSSAFFDALKNAFPEGNDPAGESVEIVAHQPGDNYSRMYDISAA